VVGPHENFDVFIRLIFTLKLVNDKNVSVPYRADMQFADDEYSRYQTQADI
jgi:hypothetical protein